MEKQQSGKPTIGIQTTVITFLLITVALFLIGFLSYDNFEKRYVSLRSSAFETLIHEVQGSIENGLALGLSCEELLTVSEILAEAKRSSEDIQTITLFDKNGVEQHQVSDGNSILDSLTDSLRSELVNGSISFCDDNNCSVSITPLFNSFHVIEGYLTLEYATLDSSAINDLKKKSVILILILLSLALIPLILIIRHLVSPVLTGIEMMELEFLSENKNDGERNEIIQSAKNVMEQALEELENGKGGKDE